MEYRRFSDSFRTGAAYLLFTGLVEWLWFQKRETSFSSTPWLGIALAALRQGFAKWSCPSCIRCSHSGPPSPNRNWADKSRFWESNNTFCVRGTESDCEDINQEELAYNRNFAALKIIGQPKHGGPIRRTGEDLTAGTFDASRCTTIEMSNTRCRMNRKAEPQGEAV